MRMTLARVAESASDPDRPGELRQALHHVRHAFEQVDARRALLDDLDGDLLDLYAAAIGADHELAREDVLLHEARPHDIEQRQSPEGLEAVRVCPPEAEHELEQCRVRNARDVADERPFIGRAGYQLAADD